jgi:DNA-binding NtrC family response regulator
MITLHTGEAPQILLVVHEPSMFHYLFDELDKRGWGFGLACEYEGAWDLLDHHDFSTAVVQLPGTSGIELYEELRTNGFTMPFILLSEDEPIRRTDSHFHFVGYPYHTKDIFTALKRLGVMRMPRR